MTGRRAQRPFVLTPGFRKSHLNLPIEYCTLYNRGNSIDASPERLPLELIGVFRHVGDANTVLQDTRAVLPIVSDAQIATVVLKPG